MNSNIHLSRIFPINIKNVEKETFLIDFGKDAFGSLELHLGSNKRKLIEICMGEVLDSTGRLSRPSPQTPECSRRFRKIGLYLVPGRHIYRLKLPVPYLLDDYQTRGYDCAVGVPCSSKSGEIMPFRYCEIKGYDGILQRGDIVQVMAHAAFDDNAAKFTCSDKRLNQVWDFCKHTIKATSCFGIYIDGDRERLPYEGDTLINQLSHFCLDTNYDLARNTIDWFCEKGTSWCYEFPMIVPQLVWHYYMYTGDMEFLEKHYDILRIMTLIDLERKDGLLKTGRDLINHPLLDEIRPREGFLRDLIDWPVNMRNGYEIGRINTVTNSFHASSLHTIAKIAGCIGRNKDAQSYNIRYKMLRNSMLEVLFNHETGLFIDSEGSKHSSLLACIHPLAHGVVDANHFPKLMKFIKSQGMTCSVWGAQFLLWALCLNGEAQYALRLITSNGKHSWLGMLQHGATMTMESWNDAVNPGQDWNHAWGTSPINIISNYIMGVKPIASGYQKVSITPQPGGLKFAQITVPTIHGEIHVAFERKNGKYKLYTKIPKGIDRALNKSVDSHVFCS